MNVSSMAKVIRSSIRKIYIPIIVLLVLCVPFLGFTQYAFADTVQDYVITFGQFHGPDRVDYAEFYNVYPDSPELTPAQSVILGNTYIDGLNYAPLMFNASYLPYYDVGNGLEPSPIGYGSSVTNFNFKPMFASLNGITSHVVASDFAGQWLYLYLPIMELVGGNYQPSGELELVYLEIGGRYGSVNSLFLEPANIDGFVFDCWDSENYTYWHFRVDTRFGESDWDNLPTGSYADIIDDEEYLKYVAIGIGCANFQEQFGAHCSVATSFYCDINYFPGGLSVVDKNILQKIDSLESELKQVNNNINDLLNYGSGSFDDLEQDIGNASDKAEQGNQEIQDNAPKPDIDNTHDDTTDIIDSVLTVHGESVSNILGAILGSNIVNGMLLISISVGAIKYIFFGKG